MQTDDLDELLREADSEIARLPHWLDSSMFWITRLTIALRTLRTEKEALLREPRCESCGSRLADPDANYCFGCGKAVCFLCVEAFGHSATGAHGSGDPADWWNEVLRMREQYNELIYAVGNKYPEQTRHETALMYIRVAERGGPQSTARTAARKEPR